MTSPSIPPDARALIAGRREGPSPPAAPGAGDVARCERVERALEESERRFTAVFRDSPVAIGISRLADGVFLDVNEAFVRLHGYTREEIVGHTSKELGLWHTTDREAVVQRLREGERQLAFEMKGRRKDGRVRDLLASIERVELGGEACLVGFLSDITERKDAERALQASEDRYRAVVEDQTEVICRFRADGTFLFVNDVYCRFFGKPARELVGHSWQPRVVEDDLPQVEARLRTLAPDNPVVVIENRVHAASGEARWMQFVNRGFFDAEGRLAEIQSVGRDVTERRQAQEEMDRLRTQLWHLDRVARTGVIAASLAHELTQPLTGILSTAEAGLRLLADGNRDPSVGREILTEIVEDTRRAGAVINGLRAMLRREEPRREVVSLAGVTGEVLALLHRELADRRVGHRLHVEEDSVVYADRAQVQQVLLNLVMNGIDAVCDEPPGRRCLELTLGRADRGDAKVVVRDLGPGIAVEQLGSLFEPFWTTKPHGMGIGLAISRSIIEAHGGRLWCENHPEGGAVLSFTLPLAAGRGAVGGGA